MNSALRTDRCKVCDHAAPFAPVYSLADYRLVRCPGCRLVFQDPQPPDAVFETTYYHDPDFTENLFGEYRDYTLTVARKHRDILWTLVAEPPGRLLDVGCSSGAWLEVAAADGWQATGVELGAATSAAARRSGLDVRTGTLAEAAAGLEPRSFDLITFWDVLEHVRDPNEELRLAFDLLRPHGQVAISCPNVAGWYPRLTKALFARAFGVWEHPELPVHLFDFSPQTLGRLLERNGFAVAGHTTFNTPFDVIRSITLTDARLGGGRRARVLATAFDGLHRVVYPLARRFDRGNAMMVVARRPA